MSSMTALLIIAFGIISVWSEPIRVDFLERRTNGQAVIECLAQGFVKVKEDMEGTTMDGQDQRVQEACKFFKVCASFPVLQEAKERLAKDPQRANVTYF